MTVKQAAERMECSPSTVYALVAAGKLKCSRIGLKRGCIRISEQQVADYLAGGVLTPPPIPSPPPRLKHIRA